MIALACDHTGIELKKEMMKLLDSMGLEWKDFGTDTAVSCDYPVYGYRAAKAVASGECDRGILICGTGIGIGIDGYGFIVIVVADDLENGHADLSDTLLVNLVEGHVVPDQVAQRNAVNGGLQFLLHVRDQQGQHLLVEHRHLVVAADLHVGQRQQGETLFLPVRSSLKLRCTTSLSPMAIFL